VEINPRTAAELDIREGQWIWIQTVRGRMSFFVTDKGRFLTY